MSIGTILIGIAMFILAGVVVAQPLREKPRRIKSKTTSDVGRDYDETLLTLRDLEFEHQLGIVTEHDYTQQRSMLMVQAAQALEQKAQANNRLENVIETAVQAKRRMRKQSVSCSNCQAALNPGDKFCSHCGSPVSLTCPACRGPVATDDNFCTGCGTSLRPSVES